MKLRTDKGQALLLAGKRHTPHRRADPAKLLRSISPFPAVARKLLSIVDKETCTIPEVTQIVRADAVFASEVLRLANSAVLGLRYEVLNIMHAVTVLGTDRLRALVLTVAMRDFLNGAAQADLLRRCWRHNFASALVAEALAGSCWLDRSDAYTAGLLHDLGQLALISQFPTRYTELLEASPDLTRLLEAESDAFGLNHCEAGQWLADHWCIPPKLRGIVCRDIAASEPDASGHSVSLARLSVLACDIANSLDFRLRQDPDHGGIDARTILESGLPLDSWNALEPQLGELIDTIPFKINAFETEFLH
ncbi:MAG: HDOD domain-containing protein [Bryobacteraceae bacterium]